MFLNMLGDGEKRAFAALARKMIDSDGIVVGREEATLASLHGEMGLARSGAGSGAETGELAAAFADRRSRMIALIELVGLGYSDTSYEGVERSFVTEVARAMHVGADDLARIETWVRQHDDHLRAALALMREPS